MAEHTDADVIGCPACRTILNAKAAGCAAPWHADNRTDRERGTPMIVRQTEAERLQTALDAVWDAYFTLVGREVQHAGRGRDGHLNVDDLEVLRQALLRATPPLTLRAAAEVGRCGLVCEPLTPQAQSREVCALPAGHAGWHRSDSGCEWHEGTEEGHTDEP